MSTFRAVPVHLMDHDTFPWTTTHEEESDPNTYTTFNEAMQAACHNENNSFLLWDVIEIVDGIAYR